MTIAQQTKTISFYTFGCRLNQSETAVIQNSMDGLTVVDFGGPADVVVINTCTVTENGDADTRRMVNRINRENPQAGIALIGCQAQIQKAALARLPNVKWIIGNEEKMNLAEILRQHPDPEEPVVITPAISRKNFTNPAAGIDREHTRANIKIQDGCDFFCSFCEIPYARGRARSRDFSDILKESRELARRGHREIVVTGINVGTYADGGKTILDVIDALEEIPELDRIRISSIEPTTIPWGLIERMREDRKLCRYLHIPLQSGADPILAAMKRKYTADEFVRFIRKAAAAVPDLCIGTDVIVGFPGESEEDFETTYALLLDEPVHYFHVFSYSERHIAKSRSLPGKVPAEKIQERSRRLRELSRRKRRIFSESFTGRNVDVLFEQEKDGRWTGLTEHYLRVAVPSEKRLENLIRSVRILHYENGLLAGDLSAPGKSTNLT